MPDWQPVTVPDLCSRCGSYWECELHDEWRPLEGRIISSRPSDDGWGREDTVEFSPPGASEIAEKMGVPLKDVTDEMTRIQDERLADMGRQLAQLKNYHDAP